MKVDYRNENFNLVFNEYGKREVNSKRTATGNGTEPENLLPFFKFYFCVAI